MISSLSGTLIDCVTSPITLDVRGVGFEIFTNSQTLATCLDQEEATFWVHHVTREDSEELFGFKHKLERDFFRKLISVSGIGPRGALAILEASTIDTLASVIENKQTDVLSKLPGIGKKTAEKIVLELHGKLGEFGTSGTLVHNDALEALLQLGYKERESMAILQTLDSSLDIEELIKQAIKSLSRN